MRYTLNKTGDFHLEDDTHPDVLDIDTGESVYRFDNSTPSTLPTFQDSPTKVFAPRRWHWETFWTVTFYYDDDKEATKWYTWRYDPFEQAWVSRPERHILFGFHYNRAKYEANRFLHMKL